MGKGTSTQTQTQNSTTNPWEPAQPALTGILSQLQGQLGNTGLTGAESGALDTIANNGQVGTAFAPAISNYASQLLSGGGATNQSGNIQNGLSTYQNQLTPYANGSMVGNNQALKAQLDQIQTDVGNSVNSQFAAAGRDLSGANQMAYGRGVAAGQAPVIAAQYNADADRQLSAANSLYGAQNTTSGLLAGLQQQSLANKAQGVTAVGQAQDAYNSSANATLQAEAARRGIPVQALGLLAQIGIPIAGLGGQSSGTSTGTKNDSFWTQFGQFGQGIGGLGKLFGGGK